MVVSQDDMLLAEFERWLRKGGATKSTSQSYRKQAEVFLDWWRGAAGRASWTPQLFERYHQYLLSPDAVQPRSRPGPASKAAEQKLKLSQKTVQLRVVSTRAYVQFISQKRHWKESPAQYLSATTRMDPLRSDPSEAPQIKQVLATFDDSESGLRDQAIVYLLASMSIRIAECCRLNLKDYYQGLYLDGRTHWLLRVPSKSFGWRRKVLVVTVGAKRALDRYLAVRPAGEEKDPLFILTGPGSMRGARLDPGGVGTRLSAAFKTAQLSGRSAQAGHSLRLAAVQFAIANGATQEEVKKMLRVRHLSSVKKHFDKAGDRKPVVLGAERLVTQI